MLTLSCVFSETSPVPQFLPAKNGMESQASTTSGQGTTSSAWADSYRWTMAAIKTIKSAELESLRVCSQQFFNEYRSSRRLETWRLIERADGWRDIGRWSARRQHPAYFACILMPESRNARTIAPASSYMPDGIACRGEASVRRISCLKSASSMVSTAVRLITGTRETHLGQESTLHPKAGYIYGDCSRLTAFACVSRGGSSREKTRDWLAFSGSAIERHIDAD